MSVMNVRRLIPTTAVAGAVALGLVTLSACSSGTSDAADKGEGKLSVVASFYPMQYLAEQIGGDHVSVETLTAPGVEPHDLELKPRQIGALGDADYILYLKGVQPAVDEAIEQAGSRTPSTSAPSRSSRSTAPGPVTTTEPPSTARRKRVTTTATSPRPVPTRTSGSTR